VYARVELLSLPEEKTIFSYQARHRDADILDWDSVEAVLEDVLERIPVKLK
jgi:hypothetical protein